MKNKLIPKGQNGWLSRLNPLKLFYPTYKHKTLKEAHNQALKDKTSRFVYNDVLHAAEPGDSTTMKKELDWYRNYLDNYPIDEIILTKQDSTQANGNYQEQKIKKLQKVKDKFNTFNLQNAVIVKQPFIVPGILGYSNNGNFYAMDKPGTIAHELTHFTGADKLRQVKVPNNLYPIVPWGELWYKLTPEEIEARRAEYNYLKDNNLFTNYRDDVDENFFDFHKQPKESHIEEEYDSYVEYLKSKGVDVDEEMEKGSYYED